MHRAWLVMASAAIVAAAGCGRYSYEQRLQTTLTQMEYKKRLNNNLMAPPGEKKFQDLSIFLRAPKEEALAKTGQLPVGEGQFDLDATFVDTKTDVTLHVLARVKQAKKAPAKGAPPPPPPPQRGEFNSDVLGVLTNVFGASDELQVAKLKEETKRGNHFKRLFFKANDKDIQLWSYKQDNHEVALIFVFDPKLQQSLASKINLCLESFATGPKATRLFSGGAEEEPEATQVVPL